jgi:hypothetical protein
MANLMPWLEFEQEYAKIFDPEKGAQPNHLEWR